MRPLKDVLGEAELVARTPLRSGLDGQLERVGVTGIRPRLGRPVTVEVGGLSVLLADELGNFPPL